MKRKFRYSYIILILIPLLFVGLLIAGGFWMLRQQFIPGGSAPTVVTPVEESTPSAKQQSLRSASVGVLVVTNKEWDESEQAELAAVLVSTEQRLGKTSEQLVDISFQIESLIEEQSSFHLDDIRVFVDRWFAQKTERIDTLVIYTDFESEQPRNVRLFTALSGPDFSGVVFRGQFVRLTPGEANTSPFVEDAPLLVGAEPEALAVALRTMLSL